MQHTNVKYVASLAPISAAAAATCNVIDCQGFDSLSVIVSFGLVGAGAFTALKIQQSDVQATANTLTGGTDVTGCVVGTSTNSDGTATALPGDTEDGKMIVFDIDLRDKKRYMLLVAAAGAATLISALAILSRAEQWPTTLAQRGSLFAHLQG